MNEYTSDHARSHWSQVLREAEFSDNGIVISRNGRPVVAMIGVDKLRDLRAKARLDDDGAKQDGPRDDGAK